MFQNQTKKVKYIPFSTCIFPYICSYVHGKCDNKMCFYAQGSCNHIQHHVTEQEKQAEIQQTSVRIESEGF